VGAVRISVGIATNDADVERLMEVICSFRDGGCEPVAGAELPALATVD